MIGFMQGRLVPKVGGKIQAFPIADWREEFVRAKSVGFHLMEWTLDHEGLYENPLLTEAGRDEIRALSAQYDLRVSSLTGDCFMQMPFWKATDQGERDALKSDFEAIVSASADVGISIVVVPLVDGGRLETQDQEDELVSYLSSRSPAYRELGVKIVFESDFEPLRLAAFIARLDQATFGVNYDIGNSAALGYDAAEEWSAYGARVLNVHIKDRVLGGSTVPLGTGSADFQKVFSAIAKAGYSGDYVLQTARATDGDDVVAILGHRAYASAQMREAGLDV